LAINFVTYPGVSLSKACFGNNLYDFNPAIECLSNLLSIGFRRFSLDIYWDYGRNTWTPCPVLLSYVTSSSTKLNRRQQSSATSSASPGPSPSPVGSLMTIGQYTCSQSLTFPTILQVVNDYLSNSSTNLGAAMTYLDINLHAATLPGTSLVDLTSSQTPNNNQTISFLVNVNASAKLYTPSLLQQQRQDLDASWLANNPIGTADSFYLATTQSGGKRITFSGWPDEGFVEFSRRLLISIGDIDAQLGYQLGQESNSIFKTSDVLALEQVTFNNASLLEKGCFFDPNQITITTVNNSWAITDNLNLPSLSSSDITYVPAISNLTACGISPFLNETLLNVTADKQLAPYQSIVYSSLWSWSYGEPRSISTNESNSKLMRCAVMDSSITGRWRVADCSEQHYGACRNASQPYQWRLSSSRGSYTSHDQNCAGMAFSVPRTGIENSHLFAAMKQSTNALNDGSIWLNFNSLSTQDCWVVGTSTSCPYGSSGSSSTNTRLQIVIPVVAAVIVLAIAGLLIFVKCAANRQNYRRRKKRRSPGDFDEYEGVPA
jgi:hypothetical protein